jgi:hypothetical protein
MRMIKYPSTGKQGPVPHHLKRLLHIDGKVWSYKIGGFGLRIREPDLRTEHFVYWRQFYDTMEVPDEFRYGGCGVCDMCLVGSSHAPSRVKDFILKGLLGREVKLYAPWE